MGRMRLPSARRNCDSRDAKKVELLHTDQLPTLEPEFDLVHSVAVVQHIPVRSGERIVAGLAGLPRPGGVGALRLTTRGRLDLALFNSVMKLPLAHNVLNVLRLRPWWYPVHADERVANSAGSRTCSERAACRRYMCACTSRSVATSPARSCSGATGSGPPQPACFCGTPRSSSSRSASTISRTSSSKLVRGSQPSISLAFE
jgi:hypothetical protein